MYISLILYYFTSLILGCYLKHGKLKLNTNNNFKSIFTKKEITKV